MIGFKDMFDFVVCFGVVRIILYYIEICGVYIKRFQNFVVFCVCDEGFGFIGYVGDLYFCVNGDINVFGFFVLDIDCVVVQCGVCCVIDIYIDGVGVGYNIGFIVWCGVFKGFVFFEFDDVEIIQWYKVVFDIYDWFVFVIIRGDMYGFVFLVCCGVGMGFEEGVKLVVIGYCRCVVGL